MTKVPWAHPNPYTDWNLRKNRPDGDGIFDYVILTDRPGESIKEIMEDYKAELAVTFSNGKQIWRLENGDFVLILDDPSALAYAPVHVLNWWGRHYAEWDLETMRERGQIAELLEHTLH